MTHILNMKHNLQPQNFAWGPMMWMAQGQNKQFPEFKQQQQNKHSVQRSSHHNYSTKARDFNVDKEICCLTPDKLMENDQIQVVDKIDDAVQPLFANYCQILSGCKKKKKRRRRRRKKKNKPTSQQPPPKQQQQQQKNIESIPCNSRRDQMRQRQISTTSEDSFIICFDNNGMEDEEDESTMSSSDETEDLDSCESLIPYKKVRFADDLCQVHPMIKWSFAYQAARKGPWEDYARDRDRFNRRIKETERRLAPIFDNNHRAKVFNERFDASK